MKMTAPLSEGAHLRRPPFDHQLTLVTSLKELDRFVSALLSPFHFDGARAVIEQIVFDPEDLIAYLQTVGIKSDEGKLHEATLTAESRSEAETMLEHLFGDWIDFVFLPSLNAQFAIYADHDEYTTIFCKEFEAIESIRKSAREHGYKEVEDWRWVGPHSNGVEGMAIDV